MRVGLLSWSPRGAHGLAAWAGRIGAAATDSNETALQKRLAVVLCAGTLPFTVLWSLIYLLVHAPLAAAIPAFYSAFTLVNTAFFAWTRNLEFYRRTQHGTAGDRRPLRRGQHPVRRHRRVHPDGRDHDAAALGRPPQ
jgi:adenylate cyclase